MAAFRMFVVARGVIALAVGLRSLKGAAAGVEVVRVAVAAGMPQVTPVAASASPALSAVVTGAAGVWRPAGATPSDS